MDASEPRIADEISLLSKSLWAATTAEAFEAPPLTGDTECDVAIIGAGFTGLSAAIHLAQRGRSVTVLEAKSPGWGASGRNGGMVIAGLKENPDEIRARFGPEVGGRLVRFAGGAADLVFELIRRYDIKCSPRQSGWLQPAHTPDMLKTVTPRIEQWQREGAPVEALDRAEMNALLGTERYYGGLIDRRCGSVHPLNYTLGLARAATQEGAAVHGNTEVTELLRDGGDWILRTPRGKVRARTVIVATNGYSGPLDDKLRRSIIAACSVQVATSPLSENVRRTILTEGSIASDTRRLLYYFRLDDQGRFIIGGRGAYHEVGIAAQQERLRKAAAWLFPQVGEFDWQYHWGGFVAVTMDHYPHLHELGPNLYAGLGYNGRGVAMATAMGQVLAAKADGEPDAALDFPLTKLRPIPLHQLRRVIVGAVSAYYAVRDSVG